MAEDSFEEFRSLGIGKHAGGLARICSDATQIIVGDGLLRMDVSRDDAGRAVITDLDNAAARLTDDSAFVLDRVREIGEEVSRPHWSELTCPIPQHWSPLVPAHSATAESYRCWRCSFAVPATNSMQPGLR
jgi:hypothetical protein